MVKVANLARTSTDDKGQRPENQLLILHEYDERRGWKYEDFVELESGRFESWHKRTVTKEIFERMKKGEFDGIVVVNEDRLARSQYLGHMLIRKIREMDRFFQTVQTSIYVDKHHYEIDLAVKLGVGFMVAELYSLRLSQAVKDGIKRHLAEGKRYGAEALYVAKRDENGDKIKGPNGNWIYIHLDKKNIFDMYKQGQSITEIAKELRCSRTPIKNLIENEYKTLDG